MIPSRHEGNVGKLNQKIFQDITGRTPEILKKAINDHVMIKKPPKPKKRNFQGNR